MYQRWVESGSDTLMTNDLSLHGSVSYRSLLVGEVLQSGKFNGQFNAQRLRFGCRSRSTFIAGVSDAFSKPLILDF